MQNKKIVNGVIVAEETNKWIATKERLPTQDGYYLVTIEYTHKISVVTIVQYTKEKQFKKKDLFGGYVVAWQELPQAYSKTA